MLIKDLQKLGYSKIVSTVYVALFELGEAKAGEIIKKTGLHRNLVYTALDQLVEKKIIGKTSIRGVALYKTLDPARLLYEIEKKEVIAKQVIETLEASRNRQRQEVVVYEGLEELQRKELSVYESLGPDDELLILGLTTIWWKVHGDTFANRLMSEQKKRQFHIRAVAADLGQAEYDYVDITAPLTEMKISPQLSTTTHETFILKDRILIRLFVEPYTTIEIINKDLVQSFREYFETLWNPSATTLEGERGLTQLLKQALEEEHVYFIGGNGEIETYYPDMWKWFNKQRIKKKIWMHDLIDSGTMLSGQNGATIVEDPYYEYRQLPEQVSSPHVIMFFGNTVANIVWEQGIATVMYDEKTALSYKKYFDLLWKQQTETIVGFTAISRFLMKQSEQSPVDYTIGANFPEHVPYLDEFVDFFLNYNTSKASMKDGNQHVILYYEKDRKNAAPEVAAANGIRQDTIHAQYLPNNFYSPMEIHVFDTCAVVCSWEEEATATIYYSKNVVNGFRKQFDMLWLLAKE